MSMRSVVDFWRSVQSKPELQAKLAALGDADPSVAGAQIAKEAGFEVTPQEMHDVGSVVDFWDRVERDDDLRRKLAPAQAYDDPQQAMREISEVARAAGYEFPLEALHYVTGALVTSGHDRSGLSDEQLDGVAGGAPPAPAPQPTQPRPIQAPLDRARDNRWQTPPRIGPGSIGAKP